MPITDLISKDLHKVTGIGRTIDLRYRSNQIVVGGTVAAAVLAGVAGYLADSPDLVEAGVVGLGTFLAWALAREIDPDHPASATLSMVIAMALGLIAPPAALAAAVVMLAMRVIVGSVGTHLRLVDSLVIAGSAALAATSPAGLPVAGAASYALLRRRHRLASALVVLAAVPAFAIADWTLAFGLPSLWVGAGLGIMGLAELLWLRPSHIAATADSGDPIQARHVTAARRTLLATLLVASLVLPARFVTEMGPALAALSATGLMAAQRALTGFRSSAR